MNRYEILKHEYDVKRITHSEPEAVAQILVKCNFRHDVNEWVWTGNNGALLKNYTGLPQMTNDTILKNYPQAQVPQMGQSPIAQDAHAQGGMSPIQSHMQPGGMFGGPKTTLHDPTGGNTMSGTRHQMMGQARGTAEGSPQRRMMEEQYGQVDPSAGQRLSSAMSSAGGWLKDKFGQAKERGGQLATAAGDRMSAGFAGAGAGLDSAVQGTKGFFGRMKEGAGKAWGAAKEGFANEMDRRQGQFDGGGARRQGTTDQQRAATFDDSALLGAGWTQQQIDTMRGATGGTAGPSVADSGSGSEGGSTAAPVTTTSGGPGDGGGAGAAASQPAGAGDWDVNWAGQTPTMGAPPSSQPTMGAPPSSEPTMGAPPSTRQHQPPTMGAPPSTSSASGQVAATSEPAHFGPLKEGSGPHKGWEKSMPDMSEGDSLEGQDAAWKANTALDSMMQGGEYDAATMRGGAGMTQRVHDRGRKQFNPEMAAKMLKAHIAGQSSSFNHAWDNLLKGL